MIEPSLRLNTKFILWSLLPCTSIEAEAASWQIPEEYVGFEAFGVGYMDLANATSQRAGSYLAQGTSIAS